MCRTTNFCGLWTDEIIEHLAEHDVAPEDFEQVVSAPDDVGASDSTGLPCAWGETGRREICHLHLRRDRRYPAAASDGL